MLFPCLLALVSAFLDSGILCQWLWEIISLSTVKMACRCYIGRESLHSLSTNLAYLVLQSPQGDPSRDSEATPSARLHIFQFNVQQQVLNVIQHGVWLHIYGSGFGVRVWSSASHFKRFWHKLQLTSALMMTGELYDVICGYNPGTRWHENDAMPYLLHTSAIQAKPKGSHL